jgi:hypothetical protein
MAKAMQYTHGGKLFRAWCDQGHRELLDKHVIIGEETYPHCYFDDHRDIALGLLTDGFGPFKCQKQTCWPLIVFNYNFHVKLSVGVIRCQEHPCGTLFRLFSPLFLYSLFVYVSFRSVYVWTAMYAPVYFGTFHHFPLLFFQLPSFYLVLYIVSLSCCHLPVYIPLQ